MKFINNLTLGLVILCFVSIAVSQEDCLGDCEKFALNLESEIVSQNDQQASFGDNLEIKVTSHLSRNSPFIKDQPSSDERFMAFSATAVGAKETVNPLLPQIENIVRPFLPDGFRFVKAFEVNREVVAGVKYEIIFEMISGEDESQICYLNVLEKPWLTKNSKKFQTMLSNNCSLVEQEDEDQFQYAINPVFKNNDNENEEMSAESLRFLEEQIIPSITTEIAPLWTSTTEIPETDPSLKHSSKNMLDDLFNLNNFFQTETPEAENQTTTEKGLDQSSKNALDEMFGFKLPETKQETTNNFAGQQNTEIAEENIQSKKVEPVQTVMKPARGNVALNQLELEIKKSFSELFQNNAEFQHAITELIENKNNQQKSQDSYNHVFNILVNNLKLKIESYTKIDEPTTEIVTNEPYVIPSESQSNHFHNKRAVANSTEDKTKILARVRGALMQLDNYDEDDMKRVIIEIVSSKKYKVKGVRHHLVNLKYANSNCYELSRENICRQNFDKESVKMCVFEIRDTDGKLIKSECASKEDYPLIGAPASVANDDKDLLVLLKDVILGVNDLEDPDYEFVEVTGVTRQIVSGVAYKVNVTLKSADSPVKCHFAIWEQVWLDNGREVKINCDNEKKYKFNQQPKRRTKRQAGLVGAPVETDNNDEEVNQLLTKSLKKLETGEAGELTLIEVQKISKQVVAGTLYKIKGTFRQGDDKSTSCTVKIWSRPWLSEGEGQQVEANCDEGVKYSSKKRAKRSSRPYLHHHKHSIDSEINAYVKEEKSEKMFKNFITKHERKYGDEIEHSMRFRIFKKNLHKIEQLNRHEQGTAKYGITEFSDMTGKEYLHRTGLAKRQRHENDVGNTIADIPDVPVPEAFDWREKGAVTEVKNQGSCGSCWAFSVTGNIEGVHAVKTGQLESYSEQELLDCDAVDNACNGGLPDDAYKAIEKIGGLELEDDYPYEAKKAKQCSFNQTLSHVKVKGAVDLPKDEVAMQKWLITNGPISIGINAAAMQFYRGGVSHPWKVLCRKSDLDHGVLIVGFGKKEYPMFNKTLPYWIVKNSWGPKWGEQGYYRVYRGDNTCGVSEMASSAVLE